MYKRTLEGWAKHWDFILIDAIVLQISLILAYRIRYNSFFEYSSRNPYRTSAIVLFLLSILTAIFFNTMHNVLTRNLWDEIKSTIIQCGVVFASIVVLLFTSKDSTHVSRIVMYLTMILYFVVGIGTRRIYKSVLLAHKKATPNREMMLVGDEKGISLALEAFETHPEEGINIKTIVRADNASAISLSSSQEESIKSSLGETSLKEVALEDAPNFIRNEWIDEVYIAVAEPSLIPKDLIHACSEMAVTVHQQMFIADGSDHPQWVEKIAKQPVITTSINMPVPRQLMIKRVVDIVAGLILSMLAVITLVIVTPFIKLSSNGPILLKFERIGRNGRKFNMYMIRTMYIDANARPSGDRVIKGIGRIIRALSLDELPKGFNVLAGSMSLVGTRAPSVSEWNKYQYHHRARLACKPGITGLWQVCASSKHTHDSSMTFEEATSIDTEYIANWSLGLDWQILFTPGTVRKKYGQKSSDL